jgi:hypothetical protein
VETLSSHAFVLELSGWLFYSLVFGFLLLGREVFTACCMAASLLPAGQHAEVLYHKYYSMAISIGLPLVHIKR